MNEPTTTRSLPSLDDAMRKISVSQNSATALRDAFAPHFQRVHNAAMAATAIKADEPKKARLVRLELKNARTAAEHTRKEQKDDSLRFGKAVDGIYNVLEFQVVPMEKALLEIEEAEERAAAKCKAELQQARADELRPLMDPTGLDLGGMLEAQWSMLLTGAKAAHAAKIAAEAKAEAGRAEAVRVAEEQRKAKEDADRAEREKMCAENERLAALAAQERKAREESEASARKEKAEADAKAAVERKRQEAAAKIERDKRAAAEAALAKIESDRKDEEEAARVAVKKAQAAPDKEKLAALAASVRALSIPLLSSDAGATLAARITEQAAKFASWIDAEAGKL